MGSGRAATGAFEGEDARNFCGPAGAQGYSRKLTLLIKCRDTAEGMGYRSYFIFPVEIKKVLKTDALFIRSRTDPLNISFIASKMAEMHSIPVIDDPRSIHDMFGQGQHVPAPDPRERPVPRTEFVRKIDFSEGTMAICWRPWTDR